VIAVAIRSLHELAVPVMNALNGSARGLNVEAAGFPDGNPA